MTRVEDFRFWYDQERDGNAKLIAMLRSVPEIRRSDPRFDQALVLAGHLAACRDNWLLRMTGSQTPVEWWPDAQDVDHLEERYKATEAKWTDYLGSMIDEELESDFVFKLRSGQEYRWNTKGQIMQLVGHAFYHRGQIALLVTQLDGQPVDTAFAYWCFESFPDRWGELGSAI